MKTDMIETLVVLIQWVQYQSFEPLYVLLIEWFSLFEKPIFQKLLLGAQDLLQGGGLINRLSLFNLFMVFEVRGAFDVRIKDLIFLGVLIRRH